MTLRRRDPGQEFSLALAHYAESGCWAAATSSSAEEKFQIFLLAAAVLRGHLDGLRAVWRDLGQFVKATHPAPTFAEEMLAGRLHPFDTATWPKPFGRTRCAQHPATALPAGDATRRGRAVAVHPTPNSKGRRRNG
jgi:hypothetical protein